MLETFQKVLWRRDHAKVEEVVEKDDGDLVEVVTNFAEDPNDVIYRNLRSAIAKKPKTLVWELIGYSALNQDMCLLIWDLLKNERDLVTRLVVKVKTSLIDAQLLFVCLADELYLSASRCFRFASLERFKTLMEKCRRAAGIESVEENAGIFEYGKVLEILDQYLPTKALADRVWDLQKLKEFGLGMSNDEERQFQALFEVG
jgi:hypothetical protein